MYAKVVIFAQPKKDVLSIPREALIHSGQGSRVVIRVGEGKFQSRDVITGMESGDRMEIVAGLNVDETVVTSAQFLIDSEASLKASFSRMTPTPPMDKIEDSAPQAAITGVGIVNTVVPQEHKINVTHEPIDVLGWPPMTMDFDVADHVDLKTLKVGAKIEFSLKKTGEFSYQVTQFEVVKQKHSEHKPKKTDLIIKGTGMINSVTANENKINVTHEPIAALGWPTMAMDFDVADNVDLKALRAGSKIGFSLQKVGEFSFLITAIDAHNSSQHAKHPSSKAKSGIVGLGTINSVSPKENKINVTHEPIAKLGWPEMAMDFVVTEDIDLSSFKVDDKIQFSLEKTGEFDYVIVHLQRTSDSGEKP